MNVEIGTEAAQFPEKEYINWIFFAVWNHTDTKMAMLFRAGAQMSVIKLILARNMIPFFGLNKTHR